MQLVGRVVFDAAERECPAAGEGTELASDSSPRPEVSLGAVVCDVTRLMRRDGSSTALASWNDVVMV